MCATSARTQLERLLEFCEIRPAVYEAEAHILHHQQAIYDLCRKEKSPSWRTRRSAKGTVLDQESLGHDTLSPAQADVVCGSSGDFASTMAWDAGDSTAACDHIEEDQFDLGPRRGARPGPAAASSEIEEDSGDAFGIPWRGSLVRPRRRCCRWPTSTSCGRP